MFQVLDRVNGVGIKNVPVMEFTDEGHEAIRPDQLIMLGGNHRREAVHQYVDQLKTQLQSEEKAMKAKEGEKGAEYEMLRERVQTLRDDIEQYQYWVVRIYDTGE